MKKILNKKRFTSLLFFVVTFFGLIFFANYALAQSALTTSSLGLEEVGKGLGMADTDIRVVIANIIRVALGLLGIIAVSLVIYGGYLYMTAGGKEDQVASAKNVLKNAVIGLIIILSSYAIVSFVITRLAEATVSYPTHCYNNVLDEDEIEIDCGGSCRSCGQGGCVGSYCDYGNSFFITSLPIGGVKCVSNYHPVIEFNRPIDVNSLTNSSGENRIKISKADETGVEVRGQWVQAVRNNQIVFNPPDSCDAGCGSGGCFVPNTAYILEFTSGKTAIQSIDEMGLNCSLGDGCGIINFTTGASCDNEKPTVVINYPTETDLLQAGETVPVEMHVTDNAGIDRAGLIASGFTVDTVSRDFAGSCIKDKTLTINWPTNRVDKSMTTFHDLVGYVYDQTGANSEYGVNVTLRPGYCFDSNLDVDKGEVQVGPPACGGACGGCAGSTCGSSSDCASGFCYVKPGDEIGVCIDKTKILKVNPGQGADGDFVSIWGNYFGNEPGKIYFSKSDTGSVGGHNIYINNSLEGVIINNIPTGFYAYSSDKSVRSSAITHIDGKTPPVGGLVWEVLEDSNAYNGNKYLKLSKTDYSYGSVSIYGNTNYLEPGLYEGTVYAKGDLGGEDLGLYLRTVVENCDNEDGTCSVATDYIDNLCARADVTCEELENKQVSVCYTDGPCYDTYYRNSKSQRWNFKTSSWISYEGWNLDERYKFFKLTKNWQEYKFIISIPSARKVSFDWGLPDYEFGQGSAIYLDNFSLEKIGGNDWVEAELANCSGNVDMWTPWQVIVQVPAKALSGPIKIETQTVGGLPTEFFVDYTNDSWGPNLPDFQKTNTIRPSLCPLDPSSGRYGMPVTLTGKNFGLELDDSDDKISFGGIDKKPNYWFDTEIKTTVPSITSGAVGVEVYNNGVKSNSVRFVVEEGVDEETPIITSFEPKEGAPGEYITIRGKNFGNDVGQIWFKENGNSEVVGLDQIFDFPELCGSFDYWTDSLIIAKFPKDNSGNGLYSLQVKPTNEDASPISNNYFDLNKNNPKIGICSINPVSSPIGPETKVKIVGEYFPNLNYDGLVAWWRLDSIQNGKVLDNSGGEHGGNMVGSGISVTSTVINGVAKDVLYFDGSESYIQIPDDGDLSFPEEEFTMSWWFKVDEDFYNNITGRDSSGSAIFKTLGFFAKRNMGVEDGIYTYGGWEYSAMVGDYSLPSLYTSSNGPSVYKEAFISNTRGEWVNMTVVANGTTIKSYKDGEFYREVGKYPGDMSMLDLTGDLTIGLSGVGVAPTNFYKGWMSDLMFYKRILSDLEIQNLYNKQSAVQKGLDVYFWGETAQTEQRIQSTSSENIGLDKRNLVNEGLIVERTTEGDYVENIIPPLFTINGSSTISGPVIINNNSTDQNSNSIDFYVQDCVENNNSCDYLGSDYHCCVSGDDKGICKANDQMCSDETRSTGYVWRFATKDIPKIPRIVERCNFKGSILLPTPAPSTMWNKERNTNDHEEVCLQALVTIEFSTLMNSSTINNNNIVVRKCNVLDVDDLCTNYEAVGISMNNIAVGTGGKYDLLDATQSNNYIELYPTDSWATSTWYQVDLSASTRSTEGVGLAVDAEKSCGTGSAYCFEFKTGNKDCELGAIYISPYSYWTKILEEPIKRHEVGSTFDVYWLGHGVSNQKCIAMSMNGYNWDWDVRFDDGTSDTGGDFAQIFEKIDNNDKQQVSALGNTVGVLPTNIVNIWAKASTTTIEGEVSRVNISPLTIDLTDPQVIDYWPDCLEACPGAEVAVRFNTTMSNAGLPGGIILHECLDENCLSVIEASNTSTGGTYDLVDDEKTQFDPNSKYTIYKIANSDVASVELKPNTLYKVVIASGTLYSASKYNDPASTSSPYAKEFSWRFRTKGEACLIERVNVEPARFVARYIKDSKLFTAEVFSSPDSCSEDGQRLNPWKADWAWSSFESTVATTTTFIVNSKSDYCTDNCLLKGSDIPFNFAGVHFPVCGDDKVEAGEDCLEPNKNKGCGLNCLYMGAVAVGNGSIFIMENLYSDYEKNHVEVGFVAPHGLYIRLMSNHNVKNIKPYSFVTQKISNLESETSYAGSVIIKSTTDTLVGNYHHVALIVNAEDNDGNIKYYNFTDNGWVDAGGELSSSTIQNILDTGLYKEFELTDNWSEEKFQIYNEDFGKINYYWGIFIDDSFANNQSFMVDLDQLKFGPSINKLCGDGTVQPNFGEECDFRSDDDFISLGCSEQCLHIGSKQSTGAEEIGASICGNGTLGAGEECELGISASSTNPLSSWGCSATCLHTGTRLSGAWCFEHQTDHGGFTLNEYNKACQNAYSQCGDGVEDPTEDAVCDIGSDKNDSCNDYCLKNTDASCVLGGEGCFGTKLAGSSLSYSVPSVCGDGDVGIGEHPTCEDTSYATQTAINPKIGPWVMVRGVGIFEGDELVQEVSSKITGQASGPEVKGGVRDDSGDFVIPCGFESDAECNEYFGTKAGESVEYAVGINSCCYPRTQLLETYPIDDATEVCPNTYIEAKFDRRIDEATLYNNVILAYGLHGDVEYDQEPRLIVTSSQFINNDTKTPEFDKFYNFNGYLVALDKFDSYEMENGLKTYSKISIYNNDLEFISEYISDSSVSDIALYKKYLVTIGDSEIQFLDFSTPDNIEKISEFDLLGEGQLIEEPLNINERKTKIVGNYIYNIGVDGKIQIYLIENVNYINKFKEFDPDLGSSYSFDVADGYIYMGSDSDLKVFSIKDVLLNDFSPIVDQKDNIKGLHFVNNKLYLVKDVEKQRLLEIYEFDGEKLSLLISNSIDIKYYIDFKVEGSFVYVLGLDRAIILNIDSFDKREVWERSVGQYYAMLLSSDELSLFSSIPLMQKFDVSPLNYGSCMGENNVTNLIAGLGPNNLDLPWYKRAWLAVSNFVKNIFGLEASATRGEVDNWCKSDLINDIQVYQPIGTTTSRVIISLNKPLDGLTDYAVILTPDVKDYLGVGIGENSDDRNINWAFITRADICAIKEVQIDPDAVFIGSSEDVVGLGSKSYFFDELRPEVKQIIAPIVGSYYWEYVWGPLNNDYVNLNNTTTSFNQISAKGKNGEIDVLASADVLQNVSGEGGVGVVATGNSHVSIFLCENPWPDRDHWPYEDVLGNNDDIVASPSGGYFNFKTYYCADDGVFGEGDDLPYLRPVVQTGRVAMEGNDLGTNTLLADSTSGEEYINNNIQNEVGVDSESVLSKVASSITNNRLASFVKGLFKKENSLAQSSNSPFCGDGECAAIEYNLCPQDCSCGNGVVEEDYGEECESGIYSFTCRDYQQINPPSYNDNIYNSGVLGCLDCRYDFGSCGYCGDRECLASEDNYNCPQDCFCGDGVKDVSEECDSGTDNNNDVTPNACRTSCKLPDCGDKVVDAGEGCDDGNESSNDACDNCALSTCGDGAINGDEECDKGTSNSDTTPNACRETCVEFDCGDGVTDSGETCDDGNKNSGDGCNSNCVVEYCGDNIKNNTTESCDLYDLNSKSCLDLEVPGEIFKYEGGELACDTGCNFDTSTCYYCGDGTCDVTENYSNCMVDCSNALIGDALKRFYFTSGKNNDVVGIQVFANEDHLTVDKWYDGARELSGGYLTSNVQSLEVNGYDAVTDGNNIYVDALNYSDTDNKLYSNIYLYSINSDAGADTRNVFEQMINNLEFNANLTNFGYCGSDINTPAYETTCVSDLDCPVVGEVCANQTDKLKRNYERLRDLGGVEMALDNYYLTHSSSSPKMNEGSFLDGQTLSVWDQSWGRFSQALSYNLPVDPINILGRAGTCAVSSSVYCTEDVDPCVDIDISVGQDDSQADTCLLHDPQTSWSAEDRRFSFACNPESYAYRYIYNKENGDYQVRSNFEDTGLNISNRDDFLTDFIDPVRFLTNGVCTALEEISTMVAGECGDGKINLNLNEVCDPPGKIIYGECISNEVLVQECAPGCGGWTVTTTDCDFNSICGNGVVEALEDCDDGILNGAYNHCNDDCDGPSSDYCGDGTLQAGQEVCDPSGANGETTYNLNKTDSCRWDCQAYGMYCGDGIVQFERGEECEKDQRCSVDGQSGTRYCGDDCKYENNLSLLYWRGPLLSDSFLYLNDYAGGNGGPLKCYSGICPNIVNDSIFQNYLEFDGINDHVISNLSDKALEPSDVFSVSFNLKPYDLPDCGASSSKYILLQKNNYVSGVVSSTEQGFGIYLDCNGKVEFNLNNDYRLITDSVAKLNNWNHIAVVYASNTARLFLNNSIMDPLVSVDYQTDTLSEFYVGGFNYKLNNDYAGSFKGSLSNINYYNKALSPSQIKDLYDNNGWICELDEEQEYSNYIGTCGNGKVDDNEACDNGISNGMTCVPGAGETCSYCTWDCQVVINDAPYYEDLDNLCGNGRAEGSEQCDDGNNINGDGCSNNCEAEDYSISMCRDGILFEGQEECDDGNNINGDGCSNNCEAEDYNISMCGDSILFEGQEECDDGNNNDSCMNCKISICGNGFLEPGEECDDGHNNSNSIPNSCRTDCVNPSCGDRVVDNGEGCDDGNGWDRDGCSPSCQITGICGNDEVESIYGEVCDISAPCTGNSIACEACEDMLRIHPEEYEEYGSCISCEAAASCKICRKDCAYEETITSSGVSPWWLECAHTGCDCGNDVEDVGEECDDGNLENDDGCDNECLSE